MNRQSSPVSLSSLLQRSGNSSTSNPNSREGSDSGLSSSDQVDVDGPQQGVKEEKSSVAVNPVNLLSQLVNLKREEVVNGTAKALTTDSSQDAPAMTAITDNKLTSPRTTIPPPTPPPSTPVNGGMNDNNALGGQHSVTLKPRDESSTPPRKRKTAIAAMTDDEEVDTIGGPDAKKSLMEQPVKQESA